MNISPLTLVEKDRNKGKHTATHSRSVRKGNKDECNDNTGNGHEIQHHRLPRPHMTSSQSPQSSSSKHYHHHDDFSQKRNGINNLHDKYGDLHHSSMQTHEMTNHDSFAYSIFKGSDCENYGSNPPYRVKKSQEKK